MVIIIAVKWFVEIEFLRQELSMKRWRFTDAEAARFVKCGAQLWIDWGLEHQTCEFSKASRANWERTPLFLEGRDDEMIFKKADKTTLLETNIAP